MTETTDDDETNPLRPPGTELLGEVVCRAVHPDLPACVTLELPGSLGEVPSTPQWAVTARPGRDGVEVRVHRLVPYPPDPHRIPTPEYADQLSQAVKEAVLGALTAARLAGTRAVTAGP